MAEPAAGRTQDAPVRPATVWLAVVVPFALGYFLANIFRTVNSVLWPHFARDLGATAADLGLMTSVYFVLFAASQLPLGIALDRYGPRRVQSVLLAVAALGAGLFAVGESIPALILGRAFIGIGVSGCLMAAIKANTQWWPKERLLLVNGITVAIGTSGSVAATVPVEVMTDWVGWRGVFAGLAALGLSIGLLILLAVPERRGADGALTRKIDLRELGQIYGAGRFWRFAVLSLVHTGCYLAYQGLWIGPYLHEVMAVPADRLADTLALFNVGMFSGAMIIGVIADRLQHVGVRPVYTLMGGLLMCELVQLAFALRLPLPIEALCIAYGFFGSSTLVSYTIIAQMFGAGLAARANTALNLLNFGFAFVVQWGVGLVIDAFPRTATGAYDPEGHTTALLAAVVVQAAALVFFALQLRKGPP